MSGSGSGWMKGVALLIAIAVIIGVLSKVKSDQNAATHQIGSGIDEGWTEGTQDQALGEAIAANDYNAVKSRLSQVDKQNIRDNIVAKLAMDRKSEALRAFLDSGWDPEGPDRDGRPLETALSIGQYKAAEVLISKRADVNRLTREGYTPLVMAVSSSNTRPEFVKLLLDSGADPNIATKEVMKNPYEDPPPVGVVFGPPAKPQPEAGVMMGRGGPVPKPKQFSRVPMDLAIANNRPEIVEMLLEHGATLDLRGRYTPTLAYAVLRHRGDSYSTEKLVRLLIARGASVDGKVTAKVRFRGESKAGNHTGTPLYFAAVRGDAEMSALLMEAGANPTTRCEGGKTPLDVAKGEAVPVLKRQPTRTGDATARGPGAR